MENIDMENPVMDDPNMDDPDLDDPFMDYLDADDPLLDDSTTNSPTMESRKSRRRGTKADVPDISYDRKILPAKGRLGQKLPGYDPVPYEDEEPDKADEGEYFDEHGASDVSSEKSEEDESDRDSDIDERTFQTYEESAKATLKHIAKLFRLPQIKVNAAVRNTLRISRHCILGFRNVTGGTLDENDAICRSCEGDYQAIMYTETQWKSLQEKLECAREDEEQLQQRVADLEGEIKKYQIDLRTAHSGTSHAQQELRNVQKDLDKVVKTAASDKSMHQQFVDSLNNQITSLKDYQTEVEQIRGENDQLREKARENTEAAKDVRDINESLATERNEFIIEGKRLLQENKNFQQQVTELSTHNQQQAQIIQDLNKQLKFSDQSEPTSARSDNGPQNLDALLGDYNLEYQSDNDSNMSDAVLNIKAPVQENYSTRLQQKDLELATLKDKVSAAELDAKNAREEQNTREVTVQSQFEEAKNRISGLDNQIAGMTMSLRAATDKYNTVAALQSDLERTISMQRDENQTMQQYITSAKQEGSDLEKRLQDANNEIGGKIEEIKQLRGSLEYATNEQSKIETMRADLEAKLGEARVTVDTLNSEKSLFEKQLQEAGNQSGSASAKAEEDLESGKRTAAAHEASILDLQTRLDAKTAEHGQLTVAIEAARNSAEVSYSELQKLLDTKTADYEKLRGIFESTKNSDAIQKAALSNAQGLLDSKVTEYKILTKRLEAAKATACNREASVSDLQDKLVLKNADYRELTDSFDAARRTLAEREAEIQQLNLSLERITVEHQRLTKDLGSARNTIAAHDATDTKLSDPIRSQPPNYQEALDADKVAAELKKKISEAEEANKALSARNQKLNADLKLAQDEVTRLSQELKEAIASKEEFESKSRADVDILKETHKQELSDVRLAHNADTNKTEALYEADLSKLKQDLDRAEKEVNKLTQDLGIGQTAIKKLTKEKTKLEKTLSSLREENMQRTLTEPSTPPPISDLSREDELRRKLDASSATITEALSDIVVLESIINTQNQALGEEALSSEQLQLTIDAQSNEVNELRRTIADTAAPRKVKLNPVARAIDALYNVDKINTLNLSFSILALFLAFLVGFSAWFIYDTHQVRESWLSANDTTRQLVVDTLTLQNHQHISLLKALFGNRWFHLQKMLDVERSFPG